MSTTKPPVWFWIVSVIALLWNVMGIYNYIGQAYRLESIMSQFKPEQVALLDARPSWVTGLFAVAVFSGALGCLLLLLRKRFAKLVLILSFLTATIQQIWWFTTDGPSIMSTSAAIIMPVFIIVVCLFLVWLSKHAERKHWLS